MGVQVFPFVFLEKNPQTFLGRTSQNWSDTSRILYGKFLENSESGSPILEAAAWESPGIAIQKQEKAHP